MTIIASGIKMPLEAIEKSYKKFQEVSAQTDMSSETFFTKIADMQINDSDRYDMTLGNRTDVIDEKKKSSFFDED